MFCVKYLIRKFSNTKIISPYTRQILCETPIQTKNDIKAILANLQQSRLTWKTRSIQDRKNIVKLYIQKLKSMSNDIAKEITNQTGKIITESVSQVNQAIQIMEAQLNYHYRYQTSIKQGYRQQPLGNILIISPYYDPIVAPSKYLINSLIAGNSILLKPAPQCLLTSLVLTNQFNAISKLQLIGNINTNFENIELILENEQTGFVNFTGSIKSGRQLYRQISTKSECFSESVFHLNCNNSAYIRADADIQKSIKTILSSSLYNSGQSRYSSRRIYISDNIYNEVKQKIIKEMSNYNYGDPFDVATKLSCITSQQFLIPLNSIKKELSQQSQIKLIYQKKEEYKQGVYYPPSIYQISQNNTFKYQNLQFSGPIIFLKSVSSDEEAIQHINRSRHQNNCCIFTKDWQKSTMFEKELDVGTLIINNSRINLPNLPEGQRKRSGKGFSLSEDSLSNITKTKSISF